jgi:ABC-2 type transport system permease protein
MSPVFALATKDLKLLVRDRGACFFTFGFPLMLAVFFGMIFGGGAGGGRMAVALINEDGGPASVALAKDLSNDAALEVHHVPARSDGERLVRTSKVAAAIVIPSGYEEATKSIFSGGSMRVEAIVDPARKADAGMLTGKLNELGFRQMTLVMGDRQRMTESLNAGRLLAAAAPGMNADQREVFRGLMDNLDRMQKLDMLGGGPEPRAQAGAAPDGGTGAAGAPAATGLGAWRPVHVEISELKADRKLPTNSYALSFPQGIVWGLMGCVMAFGVSVANERARGTLMRLTTAPISRGQILIGKAIACFIACLAVQALLLALAVVAFGVPLNQPWMLVVSCVASAFGFIGVMMLVAGVFPSEGGAQGAGRAVVLVMAMIGGGTIPLMFMPPFVQSISNISPFKWATLATEGALWRGFTLAEMATPVGILAAIGVGGYFLGSWAMHRAERR